MPFPSYLRMQSLFDPNSQINDPYGNVNFGANQNINFLQNQQTDDNIFQQILKNYQPREEAMNAYVQQLQNMPSRENYQPGRMRQIAAMLAGLGTGGPAGMSEGHLVGYRANPEAAFSVSRGIRDEPYNRALQDWELKSKPLLGAAQQEQARNVNERQLMLGELTRAQNEQRIQNEILKNDRIYDVKIKDLDRKANEAELRLQFWQDKLAANQMDREADRELRRAESDARDARHALDLTMKEQQLEQLKKFQDSLVEKWQGEREDNQSKLDYLYESLNQRYGIPRDVLTTLYDQKGQAVQSRRTTTGPQKSAPTAPTGLRNLTPNTTPQNTTTPNTNTPNQTGLTAPGMNQTAPGMNQNRIRVRNKATGQTGTIPANKFDPNRYERIQ